jgi:hypothetical protein
MNRGGQAEVEVGEINRDEDVRTLGSSVYMPYDRGSTRIASVRPVTAKPR